ncbi:MAG: hypothetical protein AABY28_00600 [Candidatus Omnitrophota bacterium]
MKRKTKKIMNKKVPLIKRDIKDFLFSEEGVISKKNIAKIGISLAVLGVMLEPQNAQAQHASHSSHSNAFFSADKGGHSSSTVHSNAHSNHSNHANHGNHGSGGWC